MDLGCIFATNTNMERKHSRIDYMVYGIYLTELGMSTHVLIVGSTPCFSIYVYCYMIMGRQLRTLRIVRETVTYHICKVCFPHYMYLTDA